MENITQTKKLNIHCIIQAVEKKYKFSGNKVANSSFNICYHLARRRSNPATTTASCNTLNNAKCQDNSCNNPFWSTRVSTNVAQE